MSLPVYWFAFWLNDSETEIVSLVSHNEVLAHPPGKFFQYAEPVENGRYPGKLTRFVTAYDELDAYRHIAKKWALTAGAS